MTAHEHLKAINDVRASLIALLAGVGVAAGTVFAGRTYLLNRSAAYAERYAKAVEQLASDGLTIRVGGVYALAASARGHPGWIQPVVEVLSSFVREGKLADDGRVRPDIAAAMQVLTAGALKTCNADLHGVNLPGVVLPGADLSRVRALNANLGLADLTGANLNEADFTGADLRGAKLNGASVRGAVFKGADLRGAEVDGVRWSAADTTDARGLS
ncbi:pentapeptide repeat-containing protein [Micromonospora sp. NPDC049836]|uniref:pentapeptide repeat-containing protein n=1 Tax=Micromonospora sp. NPDC049836 TaxID=3364274 RepID=UPI00379382A7